MMCVCVRCLQVAYSFFFWLALLKFESSEQKVTKNDFLFLNDADDDDDDYCKLQSFKKK